MEKIGDICCKCNLNYLTAVIGMLCKHIHLTMNPGSPFCPMSPFSPWKTTPILHRRWKEMDQNIFYQADCWFHDNSMLDYLGALRAWFSRWAIGPLWPLCDNKMVLASLLSFHPPYVLYIMSTTFGDYWLQPISGHCVTLSFFLSTCTVSVFVYCMT